MLAYYNDYQIENYDWFMRMDDDSVLQWDNLNEFLERGYFFCRSAVHEISPILLFLRHDGFKNGLSEFIY